MELCDVNFIWDSNFRLPTARQGQGVEGAAASDVPFSHFHSLLWGKTKAFPGSLRDLCSVSQVFGP